MSQTLKEIAEKLQDATHKRKAVTEKTSDVKVQLIYAFNGTGKTRLSREFKDLIAPNRTNEEGDLGIDQAELAQKNILYYSAFTEDLFYWDNDLNNDELRKLKIHPNSFTKWVFEDQGQDQNVITNFQQYTDKKLTPHFNQEFSEVTFSFERGNEEQEDNIKISKGEESNFIWSIFYTLLDQVIETLNVAEKDDRDTENFNQLQYVFIDDPVSSLDENHLIELAVNLAKLIKSSKSELKFIITTHNPLFYNVLHNEFRKIAHKKYILKRLEDGEYELKPQSNDSPFSYHLHLKYEIEKAIETGQLHKYHFNYLRNILEKMSTFLGHSNWGDLLEPIRGERSSYETRLINISSHSKHAGEEVIELKEDDKRVLDFLIKQIHELYRFKSS
ncbi:MAG: AAA family ATPase [Colwellia sp.]|nr:AAA family ATPase [Colwellia sp.]